MISTIETVDATNLQSKSISQLASIIARDWPQAKRYFGAVPYLDAMHSLESISDQYGADPGRSIVTYFLCNAATWRGPVAKAVKAELKARAGIK